MSSLPTIANVASATRQASTTKRRLLAGAMAMICAVILGVAAWLTPSETGLGTHEQLHMPRCGWIMVADLPCPTCGMTTAFAHAANGHLWASFKAQPLGCLLAVAVAMTLLVSLHVAATGSRLERAFGRLWGTRMAWALSACVVAAWVYKIAVYKGWFSA